MIKKIFKTVLISLFLLIYFVPSLYAVRIKDIASIKGIRSNQLIGYGLVVGLNGTGDKSGAAFTMQSLANIIKRMGVNVPVGSLKVKNVAAVIITAKLPPFARIGTNLDIIISSVGDAKSLSGGTLLLSPLKGVDGNVYALAQGPIALGGAGGGGAVKNHLLVARVAGGATIEREISMNLKNKKSILMSLYNPDFTTVSRVAGIINSTTGQNVAKAVDSGSINIMIPPKMKDSVPEFIAKIERLHVLPDKIAKIVVNEKTGTVIIGSDVSISTVAVAHGNLTITIKENKEVSQPEPFTEGETVVKKDVNVALKEEDVQVMVLPKTSTIGELVKALNAIGVTPRDLISIFQTIKAAGALQAELEII